MPAIVRIQGQSGAMQIDDRTINFCHVQSGTIREPGTVEVNVGGTLTRSVTIQVTAVYPMIAARSLWSSGCAVTTEPLGNNRWNVKFWCGDLGECYVRWDLFDIARARTSNAGWNILRADGSLAWSAGSKPLKVVEVVRFYAGVDEVSRTPPPGKVYNVIQSKQGRIPQTSYNTHRLAGVGSDSETVRIGPTVLMPPPGDGLGFTSYGEALIIDVTNYD